MMTFPHFDLVVAFGGFSGVAAANVYLEIYHGCRLLNLILEQDSYLRKINRPPDDHIHYKFFKANHATRYLEEYE